MPFILITSHNVKVTLLNITLEWVAQKKPHSNLE